MIAKIDEAAAFLRSRISTQPEVAVILGSGLGDVADAVAADAIVHYSEIPHAPKSSVVGHSGRLVAGRIGELPVVILQGRVHYYEGFGMEEVTFLSRVVARLGVKRAIVTNAAGGVNQSFKPGDLMLITDHLNFIGANPLRGPNLEELGVRFPDLTDAYSPALIELARKVAAAHGQQLQSGVYMGLSGPTYESPAEVRAYRILGADAVGMSTVPEVITFRHMGVEVLGISCITNMAAGILAQKLTHTEVLETTAMVRDEFTALVMGILAEMH